MLQVVASPLILLGWKSGPSVLLSMVTADCISHTMLLPYACPPLPLLSTPSLAGPLLMTACVSGTTKPAGCRARRQRTWWRSLTWASTSLLLDWWCLGLVCSALLLR